MLLYIGQCRSQDVVEERNIIKHVLQVALEDIKDMYEESMLKIGEKYEATIYSKELTSKNRVSK